MLVHKKYKKIVHKNIYDIYILYNNFKIQFPDKETYYVKSNSPSVQKVEFTEVPGKPFNQLLYAF